jgi:hypothetical protein
MEILHAIEPIEELGPDLNKDVATSIGKLYSHRYPKEHIDKLKEPLKLPANCKFLGVPKINREIWPLLPAKARQTDYSTQSLQKGVSYTSIMAAKLSEKLFSTKEP